MMMHLLKPALFGVCLLTFCLGTFASDWPQWRGPDRNGVSKETGLLAKWPKDGPKLVWEAKGAGRGYGTAAISQGKFYVLGDAPSTAKDKDEYLTCFDDKSGKQIWQTKLGPAYHPHGSDSWNSSRSTPTVDDDRVYVVTPQGVVFCLNSATGKVQWKKEFKDFGGNKGDGWGYSESVLIDGEKLICTPGGKKTTMLALNKKTGSEIWKATWAEDRGAGHASVMPTVVGGTRVYVQSTAGGVIGVRAKDGKLLWNFPIDRTTAVIPTLIVRGDLVFFDAGYGRGGALLKQVATNGDVKVEKIYGLEKALANKHGNLVLVGDYLYGDTEDQGRPFCAEFMTGKVRWKGPKEGRPSGSGSASIIAADSHLYIRYASGTMVLAPATPEGYKEISSFKVPGSGERPDWSHPVIANGRLYLREQDRILCYSIKAGNSAE
jgi:outer membrane protein assembly factor BamB